MMNAEQIAKLDGEAGDVFVIAVPGRLPEEAAHHIAELWDRCVAGTKLEGCKAMLIEDGVRIARIDQDRESEVALILRGAEALRTELEEARRELAGFRKLRRWNDDAAPYRTDCDYIVSGNVLANLCDRLQTHENSKAQP
jgi:hypothetical protein